MPQFNKSTGPKPSKTAFVMASRLVREGTGDHLAVAMALRPSGVTQEEIISALGSPHRNVIKKLISDRKVKRVMLPEPSRSQRIRLYTQ